jgi:tricorn protease-like protein
MIKVWDLDRETVVHTLKACTNPGTLVTLTSNKRWVISTSEDTRLNVYDLVSGKVIHILPGHEGDVCAMAVTPNERLVSASHDGTIKVWDLESGAELYTLADYKEGIYAMAVTPDGRWAVSASLDDTIKVWDLESGTELCTLTADCNGRFVALVITSDGRKAVLVHNEILVLDIEAGMVQYKFEGDTGHINTIVVTPNGRLAVFASDDRTLKVWNLENGMEIATFSTDGAVNSCAIVPVCDDRDGLTIVAGDEAGRVHVLRLEGYTLPRLRDHSLQ